MKKLLILSLAAISLLMCGCQNVKSLVSDPQVNARTQCKDKVVAQYKEESLVYTIENCYITEKDEKPTFRFIITVYFDLYFDKWGCAYYDDYAYCEWIGRYANSTGEGRPFK